MKILWVFAVYNELELLPFKLDCINKNNMECYAFDNMSTDGSWEWLSQNGVPSEQFDSKGAYNLAQITDLYDRKIHEVKPDWAITAAPDMFYVHRKFRNFREVIERVNDSGFNIFDSGFRTFTFKFTGLERPGRDPRLTYRYYVDMYENNSCIAKYNPQQRVYADWIVIPDEKIYRSSDFVLLHYAMRHDGQERKTAHYARIQEAWKRGLIPLNWGRHLEKVVAAQKYVPEHLKFVSYPKNLSDIERSDFWHVIKNSVVNG